MLGSTFTAQAEQERSDWRVLGAVQEATSYPLVMAKVNIAGVAAKLSCPQTCSIDLPSCSSHSKQTNQLAAATVSCINCCGHAEGVMWHSTAHPMHMITIVPELTSLYAGGAQVLQKASEEDRLVTAALNTHGTRAVQKLIETLATREQVCNTYSALLPKKRVNLASLFSSQTRNLVNHRQMSLPGITLTWSEQKHLTNTNGSTDI